MILTGAIILHIFHGKHRFILHITYIVVRIVLAAKPTHSQTFCLNKLCQLPLPVNQESLQSQKNSLLTRGLEQLNLYVMLHNRKWIVKEMKQLLPFLILC